MNIRSENTNKKAKNLSLTVYLEGGNLYALSIPIIIRISFEIINITNKIMKILTDSKKNDFIIIYLSRIRTSSTSQHPSKQG
jgi:hypothetical protein